MTQQLDGLCRRLRQIRVDLCGENGGLILAEALHLPLRTWLNHESGITVPSLVVLRFILPIGARPRRLLTGDPPRYSQMGGNRCRHPFAPSR